MTKKKIDLEAQLDIQRAIFKSLPSFVKCRPAPWVFLGWIPRDAHFREHFAEAKVGKEGEVHEQDFYGEGVSCWMREVEKE